MPHRTGIAEEFQEKDQLLTELTAMYMYNEKDLAQEQTAKDIETDRRKAVVLCNDTCRTLSGKSTPPGKKRGNAHYGRRKSGNFIASIMSYMERKSEVEQGIEEQRLEMEKERLKFEREKQASEAELRRQELDSVQREREASGRAEESERQERRDRERNDREEARQDRQAMMQLMQTMMNNMQRSGGLSAERQLGRTSPLVEEVLSAPSLWPGTPTGWKYPERTIQQQLSPCSFWC